MLALGIFFLSSLSVVQPPASAILFLRSEKMAPLLSSGIFHCVRLYVNSLSDLTVCVHIRINPTSKHCLDI